MPLIPFPDDGSRTRAEHRLAALLRDPSTEGWTPEPPAEHPDPHDEDDAFWDQAVGARHRSQPARSAGSAVAARIVPGTIRQARWGVPWRGAAAAVAVVVLLVGALVLRASAAAPGEPVPARPAASAGSAAAAPGAVPPLTAPPAAGTPAGPSPPAGAAPPTAADLVVHVVGQVSEPGVVRVPQGSRVQEAIDRAGGALGTADLTQVNLARAVVDGEQVVVPRPGEAVLAAPGPAAPGSGGGGGPGASGAGTPVPLNTADLAALDALPGIGPVLAQRILDWRFEHGSFTSVDELGEVSGIGDRVLEQLRPLVTV